jgi:hypothetical protein
LAGGRSIRNRDPWQNSQIVNGNGRHEDLLS